MTPRTRRLLVAAPIALLSLAIACGSPPEEATTSTSEALTPGTLCGGVPFGTDCTLGYVTIGGGGSSSGGGVKPMAHVELPGQIRVLECVCGGQATGDPQGPSDFHEGAGDVCGAYVDVPPALAGLGCTEGQLIDGEPVWACPAGAAIPAVITGAAPQCGYIGNDPWTPRGTYCEAVYAIPYDVNSTRYFTNSCLGPPLPGWQLVWDHNVSGTDQGNNSCDGVCLKAGSGDGGGDLPPVGDKQTQ